jgi:hypothetical protein
MPHASPAGLFPTDEPLKPGSLIGRRSDIAEIANRLTLGSNVILSAPRRTGKTSVCDAVLAELRNDPDCYAVAVDLFGLDGTDQLADALIEGTMSVRPALHKAIRAAKQAGKTIYESVGVTLSTKMLATGELDGLEISLLPTLPSDRRKHLQYALELPEKIAAADGKRLILYVDEFQAVQRIGDNQGSSGATILKEQMRTVFQRSRNVSFLFAGSLDHMMRDLFGTKSEPFFNFGGFHSLHPITHDEWLDGIATRLDQADIGYTIVALDSIIDAGEAHPRATMLIAQHAYEAAVLSGADQITRDTVTLAYEAALLGERPKHEQMVERIQQVSTRAINRIALRTITVLASGGKPYAGARNPSEPTRALHALRDAGLIARTDAGWQITDRLFAEYLRRNRR